MSEENKDAKECECADKDRCIKDGDVAVVNYKGTLESGEIFDTSEGKAPLEFKVGSGQLIKGFDSAVVGMKVGEKKTITLEPKDAYGDVDEKRVQKVPKDALPKDQEPKPGMPLILSTPEGAKFPAVIKTVNEDSVDIDMNHPLAGKKLIFDIEIADIKDEPSKCEGEHCGCCGH